MPIDNKFVRWDEKIHHPSERCGATVKTMQCPYRKLEGGNNCAMHAGSIPAVSGDEKALKNYRLNRWKQRISELADNSQVKNLREEIGILRMILEEMLNQCETSMDILLYSTRMSDLVVKIERLVVSCDKLENRMGLMLGKDSILQLASTYVNIINMHVDNPETLEVISQEILDATKQIESPVGV